MFNKVLLLNIFVVWFVFLQIFTSANERWREAPALRAGDATKLKDELGKEVFTSLTCTGLRKRTQGWISVMEDPKEAVMHQ